MNYNCECKIINPFPIVTYKLFSRKYQQRIPNELLCELAECLLDDTLYSIVKELTDIQHVTEKQMFQTRLEIINKHSGKVKYNMLTLCFLKSFVKNKNSMI